MISTLDIQRALQERRIDPGPLDGIMGRRSQAALREFQRRQGLIPTGTADSATLERLFPGHLRPQALPWYEEALRRKGLHETRDRPRLMAWLRRDGKTLGDPARLPWCGDYVETSIALALPEEPLPANPYLARAWLKFGVPVLPAFGAVLVFWRGSRAGISGHVGFCAGEDAEAYHVLGGNQSNAVTIARIAKDRLLGARWPKTAAPPAGAANPRLAAGGPLSTNEA